MSGVETAEQASCGEDTKPTGTAYGRMMDELVRKLNGVVQRVAMNADKHNRLSESVATVMRGMDKYEERLAKLENPLRGIGQQSIGPTYGPPNYGDQGIRQVQQNGDGITYGPSELKHGLWQQVGVQQGTYPNVQPSKVWLLRKQIEDASNLLHTARDCIKQCEGLAKVDVGFAFAGELTEVDVAYWMQENPRMCLGAFDLTRLKASIKK